MFGFYRVCAAVPPTKVADVQANVKHIAELWKKADKHKAALVVFPELAVSSYTCGDLFGQTVLREKVLDGIEQLRKYSESMHTAAIVGAPLEFNSRLYNCAVVIQKGSIQGVVPKTFLPNRREFYERRWFASGKDVRNQSVTINGKETNFGVDLLFQFDPNFILGIEICQDLWHVTPPSSWLALAGANVLVNLSASNDLVGKADYRRNLVASQSARCYAGYVYTSCGIGESTTDVLFGGHAMIAENGQLLNESKRFQKDGELIFADLDLEKMINQRLSDSSFDDKLPIDYRQIKMQPPLDIEDIDRTFPAEPFVPQSVEERDARCEEIVNIQTSALAKRMAHAAHQIAVIGVSGGLDSTLAVLSVCKTFDKMGWPRKNVIGVTMPGPATSDRTLGNARGLIKALGITLREIPIVEATAQHLRDIGCDPKERNRTYENVQARERTQILMDLANKDMGLVIGTADLSEIALGWSTYNGDHMSMYGINCGVPKTLIRYLVSWYADKSDPETKTLLQDVLATPVSPELIAGQKTEEIIGPYSLHDFFLYHFIRYGASPQKIAYLAGKAFNDEYNAKEIKKWLRVFTERFFANQFKRSCIPDGPKVGTVALSPRGDWRMPSDASVNEWLSKD